MPRAVAGQETHRRDLKTVPEGYVVLRKLNYGEVLKRREMGQRFDIKEDEGGRPQGSMQVDMERVAVFEFSRSITEHNLEDLDDRVLNFSDPADVVKLSPEVAAEIEEFISSLNGFDMSEQEKVKKDVPLSSISEKQSVPKVVAST